MRMKICLVQKEKCDPGERRDGGKQKNKTKKEEELLFSPLSWWELCWVAHTLRENLTDGLPL